MFLEEKHSRRYLLKIDDFKYNSELCRSKNGFYTRFPIILKPIDLLPVCQSFKSDFTFIACEENEWKHHSILIILNASSLIYISNDHYENGFLAQKNVTLRFSVFSVQEKHKECSSNSNHKLSTVYMAIYNLCA